ncbi:hypothetical protein E2542_SST09431 [Spatholobus suberectus]|nr:hypothetical protein E2542_SST09431 [Spatholobus suberectus]
MEWNSWKHALMYTYAVYTPACTRMRYVVYKSSHFNRLNSLLQVRTVETISCIVRIKKRERGLDRLVQPFGPPPSFPSSTALSATSRASPISVSPSTPTTFAPPPTATSFEGVDDDILTGTAPAVFSLQGVSWLAFQIPKGLSAKINPLNRELTRGRPALPVPISLLLSLPKIIEVESRVGEDITVNWSIWPRFGTFIFLSANMSSGGCDLPQPPSPHTNKGKGTAKGKKSHYVIKVLSHRDKPSSSTPSSAIAPTHSPSPTAAPTHSQSPIVAPIHSQSLAAAPIPS